MGLLTAHWIVRQEGQRQETGQVAHGRENLVQRTMEMLCKLPWRSLHRIYIRRVPGIFVISEASYPKYLVSLGNALEPCGDQEERWPYCRPITWPLPG